MPPYGGEDRIDFGPRDGGTAGLMVHVTSIAMKAITSNSPDGLFGYSRTNRGFAGSDWRC